MWRQRVAAAVEGNRADGIVARKQVRIGRECGFRVLVVVMNLPEPEKVSSSSRRIGALGQSQAFAFAFKDQLGVVNEGHAVSLGELLAPEPTK